MERERGERREKREREREREREQTAHHEGHLRREDESSSLTIDTKFLLEVPQKVSKVDVEQVTILGHHDVSIMSIADSKDKSCYAVARARRNKVFNSIVVILNKPLILLDCPFFHLVLVVVSQEGIDWVQL